MQKGGKTKQKHEQSDSSTLKMGQPTTQEIHLVNLSSHERGKK